MLTFWLLTIAAVIVVAVRSRFWPYARCPACRGRKGRGAGSTDRAYNYCRWCGGKGEMIRSAARLWPRWRAEARTRRNR
jgi:hypothetical protein